MKRLLLISICILVWAPMVLGLPGTNTWVAQWDANTESDLAGYYLYWSATQNFNDTDKIDCGLATEQVLTGNVPNATYLTLTAYDSSGNESEFCDAVPFDQDSTAPAPVGGLKVIKKVQP